MVSSMGGHTVEGLSSAAMGTTHTNTTAFGLRKGTEAGRRGAVRNPASPVSHKSDLARTFRTSHLVDLENLMGRRAYTCLEAQKVLARYVEVSGYTAGDLGVVCANGRLLELTGDHARLFRLRVAPPGANGAELALLEEGLAFRQQACQRYVIGSGDAAFVPLAEWAHDNGKHVVVVVAHLASCARRLMQAAYEVRSMSGQKLAA